jgi:WD40 repeat protein
VRLFDPYTRLVEVVVDSGEGFKPQWKHGTGCIVAGRTVLTAAHVVSGAVAVRVRFVDKTERPATLNAALVGDGRPWQNDGSVGPDLALLTIGDETIDLPRLRLAKIDHDQPGPLRDVRTVGFPWFAERITSGEVRIAADLYGSVALDSGATTGLPVLEVEHRPSDRGGGKSAWSGISGAPVLVANRLLGVVCEHLPKQGAVTFVPLTALHHDEKRPLWGPGVADPQAWWKLLEAPGGLRNLVAFPPVREAWYLAKLRHSERALRARMPRLEGRERELQQLEEFATGTDGYRWLEGGAFTGKTALLRTAVAAGLGDDVDLVSYFLSRRDADAHAAGFLNAVVPQLEVLCNAEPGAEDRNRFLQLWEQALHQAEADRRHLLLVVDGLDEDQYVRGSPSVAQLLPTLVGGNAHVHVSSRPHTRATAGLPDRHPLLTCQMVRLAPFPGAAELAEDAKAEIDELIATDKVATDIVGLLAAAAGPLSPDDLVVLHNAPDIPTAAERRQQCHRIEELLSKNARSLEPVDEADQRRYRFAHETLLAHAQALPAREYRERIDDWAEHWRDQGWPSPHDKAGTPLYLLDSYSAVLTKDPDLLATPNREERLAALISDVRWLAAAIPAVGVDLVLAWMHAAAPLVARNRDINLLKAVVAAQAVQLRPPNPIRQPGFVLRQLCLQAMIYGWHDLADTIRHHLQQHQPAGLIPQWTTLINRPPAVELGSHDGRVCAVGRIVHGRVASGGDDGRVLMWNPAAPKDGSMELGRHDGDVRAVAGLADGRVVSGGDDGRVLVWNPAAPKDGSRELGRHDGDVRAVAGLADGRVVSGGDDGRVLMWDPAAPQAEPVELGRHDGVVHAVAVLDDGRVVTGGATGRVRVWDPAAPDAGRVELGRNDAYHWAVAGLADGRVVTGGDDVRLWDPDAPEADPVELGCDVGWISAVAGTIDGRVVTGGDDGRVRVWNLAAPGAGPVELGRHDGDVHAVAVLADGRAVTGGRHDGRVLVWDPDAPRAGPVELGRHGHVSAVAVLADGRVVTGGDDVRLWDPAAPEAGPVELGHHGHVSAVAVLADGRVVTGGDDGRVRVWNLAAPGAGPAELGRHGGVVHAVAVLADGRVVTGERDDGWVRVWDPNDPEADPVELGRHSWVWAVAVLDDQRVVTGGGDGRVRVWDPRLPGTAVWDVVCTVRALATGYRSGSAACHLIVVEQGLAGWTLQRDSRGHVPPANAPPTMNVAKLPASAPVKGKRKPSPSAMKTWPRRAWRALWPRM